MITQVLESKQLGTPFRVLTRRCVLISDDPERFENDWLPSFEHWHRENRVCGYVLDLTGGELLSRLLEHQDSLNCFDDIFLRVVPAGEESDMALIGSFTNLVQSCDSKSVPNDVCWDFQEKKWPVFHPTCRMWDTRAEIRRLRTIADPSAQEKLDLESLLAFQERKINVYRDLNRLQASDSWMTALNCHFVSIDDWTEFHRAGIVPGVFGGKRNVAKAHLESCAFCRVQWRRGRGRARFMEAQGRAEKPGRMGIADEWLEQHAVAVIDKNLIRGRPGDSSRLRPLPFDGKPAPVLRVSPSGTGGLIGRLEGIEDRPLVEMQAWVEEVDAGGNRMNLGDVFPNKRHPDPVVNTETDRDIPLVLPDLPEGGKEKRVIRYATIPFRNQSRFPDYQRVLANLGGKEGAGGSSLPQDLDVAVGSVALSIVGD